MALTANCSKKSLTRYDLSTSPTNMIVLPLIKLSLNLEVDG
jgi:hypothetical protein